MKKYDLMAIIAVRAKSKKNQAGGLPTCNQQPHHPSHVSPYLLKEISSSTFEKTASISARVTGQIVSDARTTSFCCSNHRTSGQ